MGKRALVTGASGFIGSHLVPALVRKGWHVAVVVRASSSLSRLAAVREHIDVVVDPGTAPVLAELVRPLRVDACFHLATHFVGVHQVADVDQLVDSNIAFSTRVAEAVARPDDPPVFVNTGTAWQNVEGRSYDPAALYAATKQAFQDVLRYYARSQTLRCVTVKLFDTYGPRDPRRKLLSLLRAAQETGEALGLSPGEQLVELLYVDDAVEAFLRCAELDDTESVYAALPGNPVSLRELVALVEAVTGRPVPVTWGAVPYRSGEMFSRWDVGPPVPDWAPKTSLEEGLRATWSASAEVA